MTKRSFFVIVRVGWALGVEQLGADAGSSIPLQHNSNWCSETRVHLEEGSGGRKGEVEIAGGQGGRRQSSCFTVPVERFIFFDGALEARWPEFGGAAELTTAVG